MGQSVTPRAMLERLKQEQTELVERESALRTELDGLATRVAELNVLVPALEAQVGQRRGPGRPRKNAAAAATAKPKSSKAAPKTTKRKATRKATTTGRKGRRKASGAAGVHNKSIVDAAIELARQNGVDRADAGQILAWFQESGYKTRTGVPTRNSVYVSLNREFTDGKNKGRDRVRRVERGVFEFPELAGSAAEAKS